MSMVPRYWFYPQIFGDAPGQGAYQSVWLTPTRSEECPVCGSPEHRVEPLEVPLRAPRLEAFLGSERASTDPIGSLRGGVQVEGDIQSPGLTWGAGDSPR